MHVEAQNNLFEAFYIPAVRITDDLGHACFMSLIFAVTNGVSPRGCYFMDFARNENGLQ